MRQDKSILRFFFMFYHLYTVFIWTMETDFLKVVCLCLFVCLFVCLYKYDAEIPLPPPQKNK